jgi:hypothetical protein
MKKLKIFLSLLLVWGMFACSGSSGSSDNEPETNQSTDTRTAKQRYEGTWIRNLCAAVGSGYVKEYWVVSAQSDSSLTVAMGQKKYSDASCSTGETDAGVTTESGIYAFKDTDNADGISFNRADWTSGVGTNKVVWALNSESFLCVFSDGDSLASASAVASYTKVIDSKLCFKKL